MNECKQYSIYNFLVYDEDDLFMGILDLKKGEELFFYNTKITRYLNHFEVENDIFHERQNTAKECYEWLLLNIS